MPGKHLTENPPLLKFKGIDGRISRLFFDRFLRNLDMADHVIIAILTQTSALGKDVRSM